MSLVSIEERRLDNGLRVVMAPDSRTPIVAVNLWYAVGSRNEEVGRTGFAHLFEHLMFQGSANVPKNGHFERVEAAGGSGNATTWFDRTNYYETLPSHHLELGLWLESDRMGWMLPAMTSEKLENQREVVLNERRQRYENQPYGDWDERLQGLVFPESHPYHHTVIGSAEDIEAATMEDVQHFFRTYYVPNNAVLTLAGDFEPEAAFEMVERHFGPIPKGEQPPPIPGEIELPFDLGGCRKEIVRSQVPLPRLYCAYRVPPFTNEQFYAGDLAANCLGIGRASRLYENLVRERRAKSATAHLLPLTSGATMFLVVVSGYPDQPISMLEEAVLDEVDRLGEVNQEELDRAVARSESMILRELQEAGSRADLLGMYSTLFGDPHRLNEDLERPRDVTLDDVATFAGTHLTRDNCAIVAYEPEGAS